MADAKSDARSTCCPRAEVHSGTAMVALTNPIPVTA
jgi:hypothetical protein